ncbi:hypothetical protein [Streptomyces sp. 4R-3d]|nr:hypothetical protein [Streptomyces sp. 4R-3d]
MSAPTSRPLLDPKPGTERRCTERAGHDGQHYDCYAREEWPRYDGETQ